MNRSTADAAAPGTMPTVAVTVQPETAIAMAPVANPEAAAAASITAAAVVEDQTMYVTAPPAEIPPDMPINNTEEAPGVEAPLRYEGFLRLSVSLSLSLSLSLSPPRSLSLSVLRSPFTTSASAQSIHYTDSTIKKNTTVNNSLGPCCVCQIHKCYETLCRVPTGP